MNLDLNQSIRTAVIRLSMAYLSMLILSLAGTIYVNEIHHRRLAESLSSTIRNDLVIRDLRQAVRALTASTGENFETISFSSPDGTDVFSLPNRLEVEKSRHSLWHKTHESKIVSDENGKIGIIGTLRLTYNWISITLIPFFLWLFFLAFAFPIFRRMRHSIERHHREILKIHESELLAEITKQVSHDIRSPLSAISFGIQGLESLPEDRRKLILNAAARINDIANDLLTKYKTKDSNSPIDVTKNISARDNTEPLEVTSILAEIVNEARLTYSGRPEVKLILDAKNSTNGICNADKKSLQRTLSNLINNSVEAIQGPGQVTIATRTTKNELAIIVNDTGKGIPEEHLAKLGNERFTHGKSETQSGSGLGVLHAKKTIESIGGTLKIQSRENVGTMVTITLPREN